MARKKNKCEKPFNPWTSFVDIFSSVILVLLLFLLLIIVLLAYYMQFITKIANPEKDFLEKKGRFEYQTNITKIIRPETIKKETKNIIPKIVKHNSINIKDIYKNEEIFLGINIKKMKKSLAKNTITKNKNEIIIDYDNTTSINTRKINEKIKKYIKKVNKNKKIEITIYVSNKKNSSSVVNKSLALVRSVNTKKYLKKLGFKNVKTNLSIKNNKNPNGYLKISYEKGKK